MPRHYEPVAFLLAKPARVFTLAADPEIAPLLAAYGYDAATRAADQTAAPAATAAVAVQEQATGAAQRATVQLQAAEAAARQTYQAFAALCKRVALADLETRYKKLLALVDLALAGHPQLREKLGLLEK